MKTHKALIYHCHSCGSVAHCDCEAVPPICCGREMVRAAGETIVDPNGDGLGKAQEQMPGAIPPAPQKPR